MFNFFKGLTCRISHGRLTSSQANIYKYSSVAPFERRAVNIFKNTKTSVTTIVSDFMKIVNGKLEFKESSGSGIVWDTEGHIVTNYHVIKEATSHPSPSYEVYLLTSKEVEKMYNGRLVGANLANDLAALKINAPKNILKPITVGDSTSVVVGQKCFAIGAPNFFRHSFTSGIISALNQEAYIDPPLRGLIHANIYGAGGSSGGPLVDYEGHMIGINQGGCSAGIGYVIPSSVVVKIIPQLIKYNSANCPGLNIEILPDYLSHKNGIWTGAVVNRVTPHSRAAGFHSSKSDKLINGDIIIAVGDKMVRTKGDLFEILEEYRAGDTIILKVMRGQSLTVTLSIIFEDY